MLGRRALPARRLTRLGATPDFHHGLLAAGHSGVGGGPDAAAPLTIRVDVIATDSLGRSVGTLKATDFELREDGTLQSIDDARFVRAEPTGDEDAIQIDSDASERIEAANAKTRLVGIFLDEYHVSADRSARVRAAAATNLDSF